jgi:hypothetical protein
MTLSDNLISPRGCADSPETEDMHIFRSIPHGSIFLINLVSNRHMVWPDSHSVHL